MKISRSVLLLRASVALCMLLNVLSLYAVKEEESLSGWRNFMSRQDLVWNRLPQTWYEAPFMGNGSLGTYICKEPGKNAIRVDVGNSMVHDHRTDDRSVYGRGRLLIGHFLMQPVGEILSGTMRLDLWNAETIGTIRTTKGNIRLKVCVTSENPYILVEAEASEEEKNFSWQFVPESTDSPRQLNAIRVRSKNHFREKYKSNPPSEIYERNGLNFCWQPLLAGGGTATAWKEMRRDGRTTLVVSNAHTYPDTSALQKVENALLHLQQEDLSELWSTHRTWWHRFYPQSFVSLPDKKMENFYWIQMYKLASATRIGGGLPDNCGPWQVLTPWPNCWWNLNVELSLWSVYASNRLELGMPVVDAVRNNLNNLIHNVPEPYQKNAAALPVATDFELVGDEVAVPGGERRAQIGNLPWLCHNLWLQYRYSMDESVLRNTVYPTLRRAINLYLPFLWEDEQGVLHLQETYSPEYGTAEDCNYDLALLRWGCRTLLESSRILSIDDELIPRWKDVLSRLVDYPRNEDGMMIGRNVPFEKSHRHYSHLLMFYPLYLLNADQPGSKELMEKSVAHWHGIPGNILGFSFTGASSLYAAFGEGDKALEKLKGLFAKMLCPNTMYKESGPVLETPLSGAQCIHDMLLQSWGGKVRVFPAVPSSWENVSYQDLRAEGAFLVSAIRKEGRTVCIRIRSLAGESCVLRTDMVNPVVKAGNALLSKQGDGEFRLDLKKGESVTLVAEGCMNEAVAPVDGEGQNFFGLH